MLGSICPSFQSQRMEPMLFASLLITSLDQCSMPIASIKAIARMILTDAQGENRRMTSITVYLTTKREEIPFKRWTAVFHCFHPCILPKDPSTIVFLLQSLCRFPGKRPKCDSHQAPPIKPRIFLKLSSFFVFHMSIQNVI